jgi:hypothetical protein
MAAGLTLVGDQKIEAQIDSNPAGVAEAFQYVATTTGQVTRLSLYVDSSSAASSIVVGLYDDSGSNHPGTLLTQATLGAPVKGSWNNVAVPGASIAAGSKYWLAVLGPPGSGTARFRDVGVGGATETSAQTNLSVLPTTWATGARYGNAPMSAFASQAP